MRATLTPNRAAETAVEQPAIPPPTTTRSNCPASDGVSGNPSSRRRHTAHLGIPVRGRKIIERKEDRVATSVEAREIVQRDFRSFSSDFHRAARLPMPGGALGAKSRLQWLAIDDYLEPARGARRLPRGGPVAGADPHVIRAGRRKCDFGGRIGGAADYSTEISRLQALHPDVVLSTAWGGDLDTLVRQANQRGLMQQSLFVLPLVESSLERLGNDLPEGVIAGARGDNYFLNPEYKDKPDFKAFVDAFREQHVNASSIYPVFHMAQSLFALRNAYEKAMAANGGQWPSHEQVADATKGITTEAYSRPITIREDGQGLADQLLGTTKRDPKYNFAVMDDIAVYPADKISTPVGKMSVEWLKTLEPSILNMQVATYKHPM